MKTDYDDLTNITDKQLIDELFAMTVSSDPMESFAINKYGYALMQEMIYRQRVIYVRNCLSRHRHYAEYINTGSTTITLKDFVGCNPEVYLTTSVKKYVMDNAYLMESIYPNSTIAYHPSYYDYKNHRRVAAYLSFSQQQKIKD